MQPLELLRAIPAFEKLSDQELRHLAANLGTQHVSRGAMIFHQGTPGTTLYIIVRGQVRIFTINEQGRELSVSIFREGNFFGELALLDGLPRSASARAIRSTTLLTLDREAFRRTIEANPQIAVTLLEELAARLRLATIAVEQLAGVPATQRVLRRLSELADQYGVADGDEIRIDLPLTQDDLASLAGATRETVNRVLSSLRDDGLIRIERSQVWVRNQAALELRV